MIRHATTIVEILAVLLIAVCVAAILGLPWGGLVIGVYALTVAVLNGRGGAGE